MPALNKKQFFILAFIIIVITIFILVYITNGRTNSTSDNNNTQPSVSGSSASASDNQQSDEDDMQDNKDEEEIDINTQTENELLVKVQKRVEVVTNKNSDLIFKNMFTPTKQEIEKFIGIDLSKVDSYLVRMNQSKFSSELYMILKPFEQDKEEVKTQIKKFLLTYESAWSKLNQEQYQLIVDRTAVERNGYIIYIISIDNNTIMNEIRNFI